MERGSRRLLYDLNAVGRVLQDRLPAWERLELEVGPMMAGKLLPVDGARTSTGSAGRRRHVA
jgi:hypothetical protein